MDLQQVLNIALSGISAALGWFAREMYLAVQSMKKDLYSFQVEVARDYISRLEVQALKNEIMQILHRIEDRLGK
jgi:hypothetical protein